MSASHTTVDVQSPVLTTTPFLLSPPSPTSKAKMASTSPSPFSTSGGPQMSGTQQHFSSGSPFTGTMHQMTGQMSGGLERMRDWLQNWIQNAADTLRVYVNQYPPLAAFLFTLLVFSAVPVSIYVIFGLVTSAIFLTIALVGFSLVEGFVLLTSGGILMTILGGIALFTTSGFAVISTIYLGYRTSCYIGSNIWQAGGQISGQMKEAAQRAGQSMGGQSSGGFYGQSSGPSS